MRRIVGAIIGVGLCFPGALALQTVSNEFGVYPDMSLTDALLMIIIVLACALLFGAATMAWPIVRVSIPNWVLACSEASCVFSFLVLAVEALKAVSKASVASRAFLEMACSSSTKSTRRPLC